MILRLTSGKKNNKIPCSFYTFETKTENVWLSAVGKEICLLIKGKQTSTCLEIRYGDFHCSAIEVSHPKMGRINKLLVVFEILSILKS